jgi:hypothetical protein
MILLPLLRSRWQRPLFGWHKCAVDKALGQVDLATCIQILRQNVQNLDKH